MNMHLNEGLFENHSLQNEVYFPNKSRNAKLMLINHKMIISNQDSCDIENVIILEFKWWSEWQEVRFIISKMVKIMPTKHVQ